MLDTGDDLLAWVREGGDERWLIAIDMSLREQATGPRLREHATSLGGGGELVLSTDPDRPPGRLELAELGLGMDEGVLIRLDEREDES